MKIHRNCSIAALVSLLFGISVPARAADLSFSFYSSPTVGSYVTGSGKITVDDAPSTGEDHLITGVSGSYLSGTIDGGNNIGGIRSSAFKGLYTDRVRGIGSSFASFNTDGSLRKLYAAFEISGGEFILLTGSWSVNSEIVNVAAPITPNAYTFLPAKLGIDRFIAPEPTPAVPEPTTWALMILGFGLIGYAMRRKTVLRYV